MHLSPQWLRLLSVLKRWFCTLLLIRCWLFLPLWDSVIVLCFVMRYLMSILVLQSFWWGREGRLLCLVCLPGAWCMCGSSSRCRGLSAVCDYGISWSYSLFLIKRDARLSVTVSAYHWGQIIRFCLSRLNLERFLLDVPWKGYSYLNAHLFFVF